MNVQFKQSFVRDLQALRDKDLLRRVKGIIQTVEQANTLDDIPDLRKLKGQSHYFRIRVGEYRLGLVLEDNAVVLSAAYTEEIFTGISHEVSRLMVSYGRHNPRR